MGSLKLFHTFKGCHVTKSWSKSTACWRKHFSTSIEVKSSCHVRLSFTSYPDQESSIDPKKKPLVFLHGLFGAKGNLHSVSKVLSDDGRKVITYDARNHGDSQHSSEMNYQCMADDLEGLLADLNLTAPVLMGHSMGGKTAMTLALSKPDKMAALVVADISPSKSPGVGELVKYAKAMRDVTMTVGMSLAQARHQAHAQLSPFVTNQDILQFLLTNLRQSAGGEVRWRNNLDAFLNNYTHIQDFPLQTASPFTKPTLFVFGANSDHYREHDVNKIRTLFPKAEITAIKDAGHFVHAEKLLEFVRVVRQFLQGLDEASS